MSFFQKIRSLPNHFYLFVGIILFVFVFPLVDNASVWDFFGPLSYSIILLSIVSVIEKKKQRKMLWLYVLVLISVLLVWIQYFKLGWYYNYLSFTFSIIVFISATVIMISQIVRTDKVDAKLVLETLIAYLLIGVMFSLTASLIYYIDPNSFNIEKGIFSEFVYFSFVTLTTIGYGDISPQTDLARMVSIFFGLCGQLYLTIVMAFIIGKYLNKNK
jgi:voltage-gated potassium channel